MTKIMRISINPGLRQRKANVCYSMKRRKPLTKKEINSISEDVKYKPVKVQLITK